MALITNLSVRRLNNRILKMRLFFSVFAICISLNSYIIAQYRFDSWTTDNGLPQVSVNSILQTRDGFLWLTTFGGLVRYDGLRFQVFNSGNTKGLKTSRFLQLYEDKAGDLWITTEGQGITRYKDGSFTTYTTEDGLPGNLIERVRRTADGNLLFEINSQTFVWANEAFTPYLSEESKNILYVTQTGGIWSFKETHLQKTENSQITVDLQTPFAVLRLFEDSQGRAWIAGDRNALFMLKDGKLTTYTEKDGFPKSRFVTVFEDSDGAMWFGTSIGIVRFKDDRFMVYTSNDGLISNAVTSIYQDSEKTIWVGTTNGLSRLTERAVTAYSTENGLAADNVYPIYQDRQGRIWIGSWAGLTVYENGIFQNVGARYAVADDNITALFEDREGNFWIGSWSGEVRRVKNGETKIFSAKDLQQDTGANIRVVFQDRAGSIWIGTSENLVKLEDEVTTTYTTTDGLSGKQIFALHEDRNGQLWIGTSAGLTKFQNGQFSPLTEADGIATNIVRSIYEDATGTLWIGMYDSGLYRYRDGKFTHFTTSDGLFDNGAFQIIEDGSGNFWISCNLGIYRVRKSELNDFADGRIEKITSIPYNKRDGMLNSECNGGASPAGIRARDGRIWLPTQKGVAVIDPEAVPFNSQAPPVVIESIVVDTKPIDLRLPVRIEPEQTNLEIHYAGLSFINPELVKFKYKLEGLDADWIDASTRRTAFYSHLPAGKYTFRVTAANRDGVWNETGVMMEITVLPPFYQTWWFIASAILTIIVLIFAYYRWRITNLERARAMQAAFARQLIETQETERKRIAVELHDSLGQSLVLIKNWALLGLKKTNDQNKANLDEISATASEAINEVREIAYNLGPYQLDRIGLKNTIEEMIQKISKSSAIEFHTEIDEIDCVLNKEAEINVFRIVQEAANNIVKHSEANIADLKIKMDAGRILLSIRDDGKGFVQGYLDENGRRGFGLLGMSERVNLLNGELTIDSESGRGTTVEIILPCDN